MSRTALVANAGSRLGAIAAAALIAAGYRVIELDDQGDAAWEAAIERLAAGRSSVDLIVTAPDTDRAPTEPEGVIATAWRGAKFALPLFAAQGAGILLTLGFAPVAHGAVPGSDAAAESIRLLTAAALHDAQKAGVSLRSNRLYCADDASPEALAETVLFFADARSQFMSGAEITLGNRRGSANANLHGKTLLVTGATSGIGRATAIEIGRLGGFVVVGGRKLDLAEQTLAMVREAGGDGMVVRLDVTDPAEWGAAGDAIDTARGALHGLVNNAGESRNRPISDLTSTDLDFLTGINCRGVRLGTEALALLMAREGAAVLNISSVAGIRAGPGGSAYSASKAAMVGLSRGYAEQFAVIGNGIRVNSLLPGLIWSDSVADSLGEDGARAFRAMIEPKTPLGRVGLPNEVGTVIAFLLSDAAAAVTGQTVTVSGGLELAYP